uniref:Secreted protein n=2 Tax=Cacopsylla melanoneura TaxID=428564 RepID=A0A8D8VSF2_9HEMI
MHRNSWKGLILIVVETFLSLNSFTMSRSTRNICGWAFQIWTKIKMEKLICRNCKKLSRIWELILMKMKLGSYFKEWIRMEVWRLASTNGEISCSTVRSLTSENSSSTGDIQRTWTSGRT